MIRIAFVAAALLSFAACTPGIGENGACNPSDVGQCQVNLDCFVTSFDGGADAGAFCKYVCAPFGQQCPNNNYACNADGYCIPDAGTN
jgi:hypothetical protein